ASVQCLTASINSGRLSWNPGLAASTSEDGSYEISNLSPGRYRLRLDERRVPAFDLPVHVAGRLPTEVYPLQFYPNAADEAGAQTIRIEPGGHIQADFTVSPVPAFRVSGTVNLRDQYVNLSLENSSGTEAVPPMGQSNGRWSLSAPSGSWKVVANVFGNTQEYAEQSFDLRGNDLSNINLTLQPLPKIRVHISDPEASPSRYVQVTFSSPNRSAFSIAASQDNPESPQGLLPGAYQVSVSVANGSCIDTVTSGNTDLSRDPLIGSPGGTPAPIDVSLRSDCASLTVHAADGTLPASVLLISDNHVIEPAMQEAPAGTSEFANVSPGQYVVYAFSSLDDLEYANPEALREYSGQSVTLAPKEHAEVKIAIAARGGQ
ncbi:MAG TPA: hypothetical protein VG297_05150, partial [Bryobacteraceae bacterium]|nr:hypothetical protein [Bryobacteraceae bacterium]